MLHQLFRSRFAMRMLLALCLALLGMSTFLVVGPAHTAHADTATLVCPVGTADVTYSPGLTFTPRATHFVENNDVVSCVGTGDAAGINSGGHSLSATVSLSCADLFTGTFTFTWIWNNGTWSTVTLTVASVSGGSTLIVTGTGTVTAGIGAGHAVVDVVTYDNTQLLACLSPDGLTAISGVQTFEIL